MTGVLCTVCGARVYKFIFAATANRKIVFMFLVMTERVKFCGRFNILMEIGKNMVNL